MLMIKKNKLIKIIQNFETKNNLITEEEISYLLKRFGDEHYLNDFRTWKLTKKGEEYGL